MYEPCIVSSKRGVKSLLNQPDVPAAAAAKQPPESPAMSRCQWLAKHLPVQIAISVLIDRCRLDLIHRSDEPRLQHLELFRQSAAGDDPLLILFGMAK